MKRILVLISMLVLSLSFLMTVSADGNYITDKYGNSSLERLVDGSGLLSDYEYVSVLNKLNEISERCSFDVVIVTTDSLENHSAQEYADDMFDYCNYGYGTNRDGVLLLVSMEDRDYYVSTCGYGIEVITDEGLEYLEDKFVSFLSEGEYEQAFEVFADEVDTFVQQAESGEPYDVGNMPDGWDGGSFSFADKPGFLSLFICVALGLVVALVVTGVNKGQLKSVFGTPRADNYVKNGSMKLDRKEDRMIFFNVTRIHIPQNNGGSSTHMSSSGTFHGGGGGKF